MTEYDQEVLQLRLELSQIKKSYEKYHYKYVKKTKEIEKEKEDLYKEKNELLKQINDYKNLQNEWNQDRSKYEMQLEDVETKKHDALTDCTMFNEQLKTLKADFTHQLDNYAQSEQRYINNIRELENKLLDSKNCLQREIEDNRNKLCELMQHTKKTLEEKQQVIIDNESAKRMIIRLENELGKVISDNKVKDKTIYKWEQAIKMSEKAINEKNEVIKALQVNSSPKDYSSIIFKLENELLEAKTNIKLSKKTEKSLQSDIRTLDKKLKEAQESVENDQNNKRYINVAANQVPQLEEDKNKLIKQVQKLEESIEQRTLERNDVKNRLQSLMSENEKLKQLVNQKSNQFAKNEENTSENKESRTRNDNGGKQRPNDHRTMYLMEKERFDLLKFCEEKDMVIQRLQMENRILQEFITKLNVGLSDEASYISPETNFDDFASVSDIFQPLKETFTEYNDSTLSGLVPKPSLYHPHGKGDNTLYRSSEEFLSQLSQKDGATRGDQDYSNLYPTLTAAKYFTDEREKTKEIEHIIDLHMTQLRLETDKKCHI